MDPLGRSFPASTSDAPENNMIPTYIARILHAGENARTEGRKRKREGGGKPNSVPRGVTIIHLGRALRPGSSDLPDPCGETGRLAALSRVGSYLVLLRTGFAVPERSPFPRCALTAPFHPYSAVAGRCIFCGTFPGVSPGGRYPPSCPVKFGLSSPPYGRATVSPPFVSNVVSISQNRAIVSVFFARNEQPSARGRGSASPAERRISLRMSAEPIW